MTVLLFAGGGLAMLLSSGAAAAQAAAPLAPLAYPELAAGFIRPTGWLRRQLKVVRDYSTSHLAEAYPKMRDRNGWPGDAADDLYKGPVGPALKALTFIPYGCTKLRMVALLVVS